MENRNDYTLNLIAVVSKFAAIPVREAAEARISSLEEGCSSGKLQHPEQELL